MSRVLVGSFGVEENGRFRKPLTNSLPINSDNSNYRGDNSYLKNYFINLVITESIRTILALALGIISELAQISST